MIDKVTLRSKAHRPSFTDYLLATRQFGALNLGIVQLANAENPFGIWTDQTKSLAASNEQGDSVRLLTLEEPTELDALITTEDINLRDLSIRLF